MTPQIRCHGSVDSNNSSKGSNTNNDKIGYAAFHLTCAAHRWYMCLTRDMPFLKCSNSKRRPPTSHCNNKWDMATTLIQSRHSKGTQLKKGRDTSGSTSTLPSSAPPPMGRLPHLVDTQRSLARLQLPKVLTAIDTNFSRLVVAIKASAKG